MLRIIHHHYLQRFKHSVNCYLKIGLTSFIIIKIIGLFWSQWFLHLHISRFLINETP